MNITLLFGYFMYIITFSLIITLMIIFYISYKRDKYEKKCIKENNIHGDIIYTEHKTIGETKYSATVKIYYGKLLEGTYNVNIYNYNSQKSRLTTIGIASKCFNLNKLKTFAENAAREKIHALKVERSRTKKVIKTETLF